MRPALICIDAAYGAASQAVAAAAFADWRDDALIDLWSRRLDEAPAPYRPGRFFERELPLLRIACAALAERGVAARAVIVDGYATLDATGSLGLGGHLHRALGGRVPVIGVAKTAFRGSAFAETLRRGGAKQPLYVTAVGLSASEAARHVGAMAGQRRIPEHIKRVDQEARRALAASA